MNISSNRTRDSMREFVKQLLMSNSMHVNIANNRWALKVLYNPCVSQASTYIIRTIPSTRCSRPQTMIEINSSLRTDSLLVVRQHFVDRTMATILQSNLLAFDRQQPILTADIIAQAVDVEQFDTSSCSVCLGDFHLADSLLQLTCKHVYHRECLLQWLQTHFHCPYCRFIVYQQPVTPHIFLIR